MKRIEVGGVVLRVANPVARHMGSLPRPLQGPYAHIATATIDGRTDQVAAVDRNGVLLVTDAGHWFLPWDEIDELGATWLRRSDGSWLEIRHDSIDQHDRFIAAMPPQVGERYRDRIERAAPVQDAVLRPPVLSHLVLQDPGAGASQTADVLAAHLQTVVDGERGGHAVLLQVSGRDEPLVILHPSMSGLQVRGAFRVETQQAWDDLVASLQSTGQVSATWWQTPEGEVTRVMTTASWTSLRQPSGAEAAPGPGTGGLPLPAQRFGGSARV